MPDSDSDVCFDLDQDHHVSERPAGRKRHDVWEHLTDAQDPQKLISAACKHCMQIVTYRRKSERARGHLLKCKNFAKTMMLFAPEDRPPWFNESHSKKSKIVGSPVASSTQSSIRDHMLPTLSKKQKDQIKECIALHYYITGTSFVRIEEANLLKAFQLCRPDVELPDRKQLAGPLLEKCYERVRKETNSHLQNMKTSMFCLTTDGWSNIKNEPIINYMLIGSTATFFLESVSTGEASHDAQFIANDIARVIDDLLERKINICGAVTDNTSTNKAAWNILSAKYPSMFFHGCACHGLHLMVKDIFAPTKAKRGRPVADYPEDYPFEHLLRFALDCKDVVSYFSYHQQIKAQLVKEQTVRKLPALAQPASTRWGTLKACFVSLLKSESVIHSIVTSRDFISGTSKQKASAQNVHDIVTSKNFVPYLQKSIAILKSIDDAIVRFQSDSVPVSEICHFFKVAFKKDFQSMDGLVVNERSYLLHLLEKRMDFLYGDAIGFAYLLDPRYLGEGMSVNEKRLIEDKLFSSMVDQKEQIFSEYTSFVINASNEKDCCDFRFQMLQKGTKTILQYWTLDGKQYPHLRATALRVFSMATSSAASERNFSMNGFIHSKLRNSLKEQNVQKLLFIKSNASQLGQDFLSTDYPYSEDDAIDLDTGSCFDDDESE
jgi:hypothetical protein